MGRRDSSTATHKRAMKMLTTFFLLFSICFIFTLITSRIFLKVQRYQVMVFIMVISPFFPSGHSFIIIFGNSELRQIT
nr:PREDICTED: taste receptor type 2 member 42-like [Equus przewalskii]